MHHYSTANQSLKGKKKKRFQTVSWASYQHKVQVESYIPLIKSLIALNIVSTASGLPDFWLKLLIIIHAPSRLPLSACLGCANTIERISIAYLIKIKLNRLQKNSNRHKKNSSALRFNNFNRGWEHGILKILLVTFSAMMAMHQERRLLQVGIQKVQQTLFFWPNPTDLLKVN